MRMRQNESGPRMVVVMDAAPCKQHKAAKGTPCWTIYSDGGKMPLNAVCGRRVKQAGFATPVSSDAMSEKPSAKAPGKPPYHHHKATKRGRPHPTTSSRAKDNS